MKKASKQNHQLYNKNLRHVAHKLRYTMTKAEACLWKYALRAKTMGYTFNRQRPVLNYVVDFMCKELKLVIEVDGYSHHLDEVIEKDRKKQMALEKAGFIVLRFSDDEILKGIHNVIRAIDITIEKLETTPPPAPSERGTKPSPPAPSERGTKTPPPAPSERGTKPLPPDPLKEGNKQL